MECTIREALLTDTLRINEIANWYIENSAVNFDTEAWSLEKRLEWRRTFNQPDSPYKLLVCESQGQVIGFACNTRFRSKAAYTRSTETTVYIANDVTSNGRGAKLYHGLFDMISSLQFHRAIAVITLPNPASIVLHERMGFSLVGTFDEIGGKFEKYHSVAMYQKNLPLQTKQ
jgi:phosphinothricin acetyltransferase